MDEKEKIFRISIDLASKTLKAGQDVVIGLFKFIIEKYKESEYLGELSLQSFLQKQKGMVKIQEIPLEDYATYRKIFSQKIPFAFETRNDKHYFVFSKQHEDLITFELQTLLQKTLQAEERKYEDINSENSKSDTKNTEHLETKKQSENKENSAAKTESNHASKDEIDSSDHERKEHSLFFEELEEETSVSKELRSPLIDEIREKIAKENMRFSLRKNEQGFKFIFETEEEHLKEKLNVLSQVISNIEQNKNSIPKQQASIDTILQHFKKEVEEEKLSNPIKEKNKSMSL